MLDVPESGLTLWPVPGRFTQLTGTQSIESFASGSSRLSVGFTARHVFAAVLLFASTPLPRP